MSDGAAEDRANSAGADSNIVLVLSSCCAVGASVVIVKNTAVRCEEEGVPILCV